MQPMLSMRMRFSSHAWVRLSRMWLGPHCVLPQDIKKKIAELKEGEAKEAKSQAPATAAEPEKEAPKDKEMEGANLAVLSGASSPQSLSLSLSLSVCVALALLAVLGRGCCWVVRTAANLCSCSPVLPPQPFLASGGVNAKAAQSPPPTQGGSGCGKRGPQQLRVGPLGRRQRRLVRRRMRRRWTAWSPHGAICCGTVRTWRSCWRWTRTCKASCI